MSYGIVRLMKFTKGSVKGIELHDLRKKKDEITGEGISHSNPDIDWSRSDQNYNLHLDQHQNFHTAIKDRINSLDLKRAVRKDAIVMTGFMITSDHDFFKNLNNFEQTKFFQESYDFIANRYGSENIISAIVHLDEKTPHMHLNLVPVTDDGRLSAKSIFTRQELIKLHDDFHKQVGQSWGLDRGEEGGNKKHLATMDFKVATAKKELLELEDKTQESLKMGDKFIEQKRNFLDQLRSDYDQTAISLQNTQNSLSEAQIQVESVNSEVKRLEAEKKRLKAENEKLAEKNQNLETDLSEAKATIKEAKPLQAQLSNLKEQVTEKETQFKQLNADLKNAKESLNTAHIEVTAEEKKRDAVKKDYDYYLKQSIQLKEANEKYPHKTKALVDQVNRLDADIEERRSQINDLRSETSELQDQHRQWAKIRQQESSIDEIKDSVKDACKNMVRHIERNFRGKVRIPRDVEKWAEKKPGLVSGLFKTNDRIFEAREEKRDLIRQQKERDEEKQKQLDAVDQLKQNFDRQADRLIEYEKNYVQYGEDLEDDWDLER